MALTVNNLGTLNLLTILNRTAAAQDATVQRMSTGYRINKGVDDPAGMIALTGLNAEIGSVDSAISNNQRTDALLGVADGSLSQIGELLSNIQALADESANDGGLSADELAANQAQIDDALASIDRIVSTTQFNGKKLLDGSLGINTTYTAADLSDVKVYSRKSGSTDTSLVVDVTTDAAVAKQAGWMTAPATAATTVSIQGKLGTAVISWANADTLATIKGLIDAAKNQTGVEASVNGANLSLKSSAKGEAAFVRTTVITGQALSAVDVKGTDAVVTVNGQVTAVDGTRVNYTGNGVSVAFDVKMLAATAASTLVIKGGNNGATFNLGTNASTRATIGVDGVYAAQLGDATTGYLSTLGSGGTNSLLNDPSTAATIARKASSQIATLRGRIGGFQKFQVRTALDSLGDTKQGLENARSTIRDVDYAKESADLNRYSILMQSAMSMLGIVNQQSASVLALLR